MWLDDAGWVELGVDGKVGGDGLVVGEGVGIEEVGMER